MKTNASIKRIQFVLFLSSIILFGVSTGFSQDIQKNTVKKEKKATVVVTVKKENGKTTVIDTTFDLSTPEGEKKFQQYMKECEKSSTAFEDKLRNMEIMVSVPDFPDSMDTDSITGHLKVITRDGRNPRCPPPPPLPPGEFDFTCFGDMNHYRDLRGLFKEDGKQTLGDIIGDIPMDRVKSYVIKDRKGGKRIIIDVEDAPLIEKHDRIIMLREPSWTPRQEDPSKKVEKRIIIRTDDDEKPGEK